jgi:murein tripeptide amidase MpaA
MQIIVPDDNGNIVIVNQENSKNIRLNIRPDNAAPDVFQWFNFNVTGAIGEEFVLHIENAGKARYAGWNDQDVLYRATGSSDENNWMRLDTSFNEETGILTIRGKLDSSNLHIAFFPPYPYSRHLSLMEQVNNTPGFDVEILGKTKEGRDITLLRKGIPGPDKKNIWVLARLGSGSGTPAAWFTEGLIERLATESMDGVVIYVVPDINPDGTYHGNLQTDAGGINLNRQWNLDDNQDSCPQVYFVRQKMLEEGVAEVVVVDGDEVASYPYILGRELGCTMNQNLSDLQKDWITSYQIHCPVVHEKSPYPQELLNQAPPGVSTKFFAEPGCLAVSLNLPFKEQGTGEDWTIDDCKQLGFKLPDSLTPSLISRLENKYKPGFRKERTASPDRCNPGAPYFNKASSSSRQEQTAANRRPNTLLSPPEQMVAKL